MFSLTFWRQTAGKSPQCIPVACRSLHECYYNWVLQMMRENCRQQSKLMEFLEKPAARQT